MKNNLYKEFLKNADEFERELEKYKERAYELLQLSDCCSLIPFNTFDLAINNRLYHRACTKEYLIQLITNSIYGLGIFDNRLLHITDVRISLKESLVDLIVDE